MHGTDLVRKPKQKGCASVTFGFLVAVGLLFLFGVAIGFTATVRTYFWDKTPCTIIDSRRIDPGLEKPGDGDPFILRYRYDVDGSQYTSRQLTKGIKESLSTKRIEQLLREYPEGSRGVCYVNPKNAREAILQRGSLWFGLFALLPLTITGVGVGGLMATYDRRSPASIAAAHRARLKKVGDYVPHIFFGLCTLIGGLLSYFLVLRTAVTYIDARSWREVPCEIVSSSVGHHRSTSDGKTSTTYSVDITYKYRFDGREYIADRYEIFGGSSSGRRNKAAIVKRYPAGSKAVCYVNPKDPTDALIDRSPSAIWLVGLFPLLFFVVGVSGLFGLARSAFRASGTLAQPVLPSAAASVQPAVLGGEIDLKPNASPAAKFLGMVTAAVIWNGITSVFATMAVRSWMEGRGEIFLSIIITPFVLIGLALIGGIFYTFLGLFNPRLRLRVNATALPLGSTLQLRWDIAGASGRIQHLRITLEAREEATYRRGTRSSTDRSVFLRLPLIDTQDPLQIRHGSGQAKLPRELVPTWSGGNNRIIWELKVRGEIPRYPDLEDSYPFTALPPART